MGKFDTCLVFMEEIVFLVVKIVVLRVDIFTLKKKHDFSFIF